MRRLIFENFLSFVCGCNLIGDLIKTLTVKRALTFYFFYSKMKVDLINLTGLIQ